MSVTRKQELELTQTGKGNRPILATCSQARFVKSGQKKRATLSDHPIAIARSSNSYRPFSLNDQAPFGQLFQRLPHNRPLLNRRHSKSAAPLTWAGRLDSPAHGAKVARRGDGERQGAGP